LSGKGRLSADFADGADSEIQRRATRSRPKPVAVPARRDQRHRVQGGALVRRCARCSKVRTLFEKCASWKTPRIPSKMRTSFQDAHRKLRTFEPHSREGLRMACVGTQAAKKSPSVGKNQPGRKPKPGFDAGSFQARRLPATVLALNRQPSCARRAWPRILEPDVKFAMERTH